MIELAFYAETVHVLQGEYTVSQGYPVLGGIVMASSPIAPVILDFEPGTFRVELFDYAVGAEPRDFLGTPDPFDANGDGAVDIDDVLAFLDWITTRSEVGAG